MNTKFVLLLVASVLLSSSVAFAQADRAVPPAYQQKLALNESKLKAIEGKTTAILSRKSIIVADENTEKEMYAYAEQMKAAYDEAMREADKAAKSNGREGNTALLNSFETMAKKHEARANNLAKSFERIEASLKIGEIVLDKPVLMRMSPQEKNEFKKFLAPQGLQKIERLHPGILNSGTSMNLFDFDAEKVGCAVKSAGSMLADGISDFFVQDAEAKYAGQCIPTCFAKKWSACAVCIGNSGGIIINYYNNTFIPCWKGCPWWKPWCKAKCLANLIAMLA